MSWTLIDVSDLIAKPGARKRVVATEALGGLEGGLGKVRDSDPIQVDLLLESISEGIAVTGEVAGSFELGCSRCLLDFEERFAREVDEVFHTGEVAEQAPDQVPDASEAYRVVGTTVDLEQMLRDAVVLAIPIRPLHSPDCKGLCPKCGADLNVEECGHDQQASDERWAPLKGLFTQEGLND